MNQNQREEAEKSLNSVCLLLNILHFFGVVQAYFFITAVYASDTFNMILSGAFTFWFAHKAAQYQYQKRQLQESLTPEDKD